MNQKRNFSLGFSLSFISAFFWGTTYIIGRYLMRDKSIDPITLSLLRYLFASLLLFVIGIFIYGVKAFTSIRMKDLAKIAPQGIIGMAGMSVFLFLGQHTASAVNSSIIMSAIPVLILICGVFIGEKITLPKAAGMVASTVGCFMVIGILTLKGIKVSSAGIGELLTFCSALCWTVYTIWSRATVRKIGGYIYTVYAFFFGALALLPVWLLKFHAGTVVLPSSSKTILAAVYITLFCTALAFFAWNQAQTLISLSLLNIMQYLTPVTVLALSYAFLREPVSLWQLFGAALVILGVSLDESSIGAVKRIFGSLVKRSI